MTILWENIIITFVALAVFAVVAVLIVKSLLRNRKTRR
jgi:heme exporter protein D